MLKGSLREIAQYYTHKINRYGPTPLGVDWPCKPTQDLRFIQLMKVVRGSQNSFSINDLGCGYGALLPFLRRRFSGKTIDYSGLDISKAMVVEALKLWAGDARATFQIGHEFAHPADYSVASGIFNIKLNCSEAAWTRYIQKTLRHLHSVSRCGYAVNFLSQPTLSDGLPPEVYFASANAWKVFCERELNSSVTVISDYGMHEFTLLGMIAP
ncbi:MAG: class I SAM-dependent methyltransferase [Ramlibacter sp.]|nr:class I SAM-dependent methyltransferase [Ramlibacter sp.]